MAFSCVLRNAAPFLISILQFVSAEAVNYPVGVSLKYYKLSSAYYNAQNELIHVAATNSSQEWRDYFQAT
ncbi:hypothetical protein BDZ45DRAFT_678022 [Acephala macrosclerotiorum]|nr:hypothetical protein BDZ45DRAFT_678022 [Acephala macrosclerotiorum]